MQQTLIICQCHSPHQAPPKGCDGVKMRNYPQTWKALHSQGVQKQTLKQEHLTVFTIDFFIILVMSMRCWPQKVIQHNNNRDHEGKRDHVTALRIKDSSLCKLLQKKKSNITGGNKDMILIWIFFDNPNNCLNDSCHILLAMPLAHFWECFSTLPGNR